MDKVSLFTLMYVGGGLQLEPCNIIFSEKCLCSHNNNNALIKQLSMFDAALVVTNT